jgi:hypothetical protein
VGARLGMTLGWVVAAALVPLAWAGCGSQSNQERADSTATPARSATPTVTPTPTATAESDTFSDQAAADLATAYVAAITAGNWKKACLLHDRRVRRLFARLGSCEAGIASFWTSERKLLGYLKTATAGAVLRRGRRAEVEYDQPSGPNLGLNFIAVKERCRWRLDEFKPSTAGW